MDIIIALICLATFYQPISHFMTLHIWYFMAINSHSSFLSLLHAANSHLLTCHPIKMSGEVQRQLCIREGTQKSQFSSYPSLGVMLQHKLCPVKKKKIDKQFNLKAEYMQTNFIPQCIYFHAIYILLLLQGQVVIPLILPLSPILLLLYTSLFLPLDTLQPLLISNSVNLTFLTGAFPPFWI